MQNIHTSSKQLARHIIFLAACTPDVCKSGNIAITWSSVRCTCARFKPAVRLTSTHWMEPRVCQDCAISWLCPRSVWQLRKPNTAAINTTQPASSSNGPRINKGQLPRVFNYPEWLRIPMNWNINNLSVKYDKIKTR